MFLSVGPRYVDQVDGVAFGFVFDAEELLRSGAILGIHDLANDYTGIIGEVAEEVAATLPRLPRISDAELDEFMTLMGETDLGMRQFISDNSTNPESELLEALSYGKVDYSGHTQAVSLIKQRIAALHQEKRLSGAAALDYLRQSPTDGQLEILVLEKLSLAQATGEIQYGREI